MIMFYQLMATPAVGKHIPAMAGKAQVTEHCTTENRELSDKVDYK